MARNITLQGADYSDVPAVLLPITSIELVPLATANISQSIGSGYYADQIPGLNYYYHDAVTAIIDGVTLVLPRDPDPNNYADGYTGYGAHYTSGTSMDFSSYAYRVEDDDHAGKWRLYASTTGSHTIRVLSKDQAAFYDVADTTAAATDVAEGKLFYTADGILTEGTAGSGTIPLCMRPDAELVKSFAMDALVVDDLELTIPAYSTTAQTLRSSLSLSPTITIDYDHEWLVLQRILTKPIYNTDTPVKGRNEYLYTAGSYELVTYPGNTFVAADGKKYTSRSSVVTSNGTVSRLFYWSSASAVTIYSTASYGCYQTIQAPSISGTTLTVKSPTIAIRGHATYLPSAVWGTITDIRCQYVIEVWKCPKTPQDGWSLMANSMHIIGCAQSAGGTLT